MIEGSVKRHLLNFIVIQVKKSTEELSWLNERLAGVTFIRHAWVAWLRLEAAILHCRINFCYIHTFNIWVS